MVIMVIMVTGAGRDNPPKNPRSGIGSLDGRRCKGPPLRGERAQSDPQIITRHGKPSVVIVSAEEWARKTVRKGTLAEFLMASPLRDANLVLDRVRDQPRDLDL